MSPESGKFNTYDSLDSTDSLDSRLMTPDSKLQTILILPQNFSRRQRQRKAPAVSVLVADLDRYFTGR